MMVTWTKNLIFRSLISASLAPSKSKMKKHPRSINKMQKDCRQIKDGNTCALVLQQGLNNKNLNKLKTWWFLRIKKWDLANKRKKHNLPMKSLHKEEHGASNLKRKVGEWRWQCGCTQSWEGATLPAMMWSFNDLQLPKWGHVVTPKLHPWI
jgi:hypothetical protein